jgi:hypothetical protein
MNYLARIDVGKKGTPTGMAVTELNDGGSEENELRSRRSNHVFLLCVCDEWVNDRTEGLNNEKKKDM